MARLENDKKGNMTIDGKKVLCGFETFGGWYFFGIELTEERRIGVNGGGSLIRGKEYNDRIWFGLVQRFEEEWGSFSETEITLAGAWKIKACDLPYSGRRSE